MKFFISLCFMFKSVIWCARQFFFMHILISLYISTRLGHTWLHDPFSACFCFFCSSLLLRYLIRWKNIVFSLYARINLFYFLCFDAQLLVACCLLVHVMYPKEIWLYHSLALIPSATRTIHESRSRCHINLIRHHLLSGLFVRMTHRKTSKVRVIINN